MGVKFKLQMGMMHQNKYRLCWTPTYYNKTLELKNQNLKFWGDQASAIVTSTSTPGSMVMEVICLTTSGEL